MTAMTGSARPTSCRSTAPDGPRGRRRRWERRWARPSRSGSKRSAAVQRLTVEAFPLGPATAAAVETALADRRLMRLRLVTREGGIDAAVAHYADNATPD